MNSLQEKEEIKNIVNKTNLKHIAIIMDGNRRWARKKMLPTAVGHKAGVSSLKEVVKACDEFGIKYLTVYAFSTENWNRPKDEVEFLMQLLAKTIDEEFEELKQNNVKLKFIGDMKALNENLREILNKKEKESKENTGVNLQVAINYGARLEIKECIKKIIKNGYKEEEITDEIIEDNLYTKGIPYPDMLIRTGGEMRISNYLLWQIAYSEIYVTETFWPDFNKKELERAIMEYSKRSRRYGR